MTSLLPRCLLFVLGIALFTGLAGCESTSKEPSLRRLKEEFVLARNTPVEEVVAHLGEPELKYPLEDYSIDAEVWVYSRTLVTDSRMVLTDTRQVPIVNPETGRITYIEEPIYAPQNETAEEKTELLVVAGKVVKWRRSIDRDQQYGGGTHW